MQVAARDSNSAAAPADGKLCCVFVQAEEGVLLRGSLSKMDWESWLAIRTRAAEVPL